MIFEILDRWGVYQPKSKNMVFLTWDNWNDFNYYTSFGIFYVDNNSKKQSLGNIMIGFKGQKEKERVFNIGHYFDYIGDDYFSLGQSEEYYENLKKLDPEVRDEILILLNDLAKNIDLLEAVIHEPVVEYSFLRSLSKSTITGQFKRLALGGAKLTPYSFSFSQVNIDHPQDLNLSFDVEPESLPPSNVHVLIGRNGVGKTYLINNMINSLLDSKSTEVGFKFKNDDDHGDNNSSFANLICISFSAFDELNMRTEDISNVDGLKYSYIGLRYNSGLNMKDPATLPDEFYESLSICKSRGLKKRWEGAVSTLRSDPNFREAGVVELISLSDSRLSHAKIIKTFRRLSSGHKIILLTITKLIEKLQERSLVIMDEPEAHLHPPLLSAFIRTVSDLLTTTNGVAMVATHSPVILQEVPKSCAWKLRRSGSLAVADRFDIESFGENIGILTNEIFGLEVTESGFYKLLSDLAESKYYDFNAVLKEFNYQLGMEARSVLMAIIASKNK